MHYPRFVRIYFDMSFQFAIFLIIFFYFIVLCCFDVKLEVLLIMCLTFEFMMCVFEFALCAFI